MAELFSNDRLIDYFSMFEMNIQSFLSGENDFLEKTDYTNSNNIAIKVQYKYNTLKRYPLKDYKDVYELNLESIFQMLPVEYIYLNRQPNKFFSLIFTNST